MKSYLAKAGEVEKKWYVVDAAGKPLGRVASQVASILRGKNKPEFTPNVDTGDFVIIINAEKVLLTGKKLDQKMMRHHSLYPGGLKETLRLRHRVAGPRDLRDGRAHSLHGRAACLARQERTEGVRKPLRLET